MYFFLLTSFWKEIPYILLTLNHHSLSNRTVKGECIVFKFFFIMDENDALSEYNKIPLGHNRTNGAVYFKIYFKVEICTAH